MLAREPALVAAKDIPDLTLARAAAAKHNAQEARLAALKAKQEAEAAKRKGLDEKNKAREEARAAAMKPKQNLQADGRPKLELGKSNPEAAKASAPAAASAPVQPLLRMPAPEGPPAPRNL